MASIPANPTKWLDALRASDPPHLVDHLADELARGLLPSTLVARRLVLRAAERDLAPATLPDVDETALRRWWRRRHGTRGLAAPTRVAHRAHLRRWFAWALEEGLRDDDPARRLDAPKLRGRLPRPIAPGDVRRLLAAEDLASHERLALRLAVHAGLRAHEVAKVRPGDVSLDDAGAATLRVVGKGAKERAVPLPADLAAQLLAAPAGWPVVRRPGHDGYTPAGMSALLARVLRAHDVDATGHRLRHTAGTQLYAATGDIHATAAFLGHADIRTAAGYARADPQRMRLAAEAAWASLSVTDPSAATERHRRPEAPGDQPSQTPGRAGA
jgi:integrase